MDSYIGAIYAFGFNFPPVNYMACQGQLVQISEYEALYTLIGTTYGGDGVSTFGLPNLQSRVPIGTGQGTGLSNYNLGQSAGTENVTLTVNNLAAHTHPLLTAQIPVGTTSAASSPSGAWFGASSGNIGNSFASGTPNATMMPDTGNSSTAGGTTPINIINPYQAVNYCICVFGIYPTHP